MDNHHLRSMAQDLSEAGLITKDQVDQATKTLEKHWKTRIALTWCKEDVLERAKELGKEITDDQADEVLGTMLNKHDCTIGVSWDTIDTYLDFVE